MRDRLQGEQVEVVTPTPEPEPERRVRLQGMDLQLKETTQNAYTAEPPAGTSREDVMDPSFWMHVATRLRPKTEVTVLPQDGAFYMKVFVRYADRTSARIHELDYQELQIVTAEEVENRLFDIGFNSGNLFFVYRKADSAVLQAKFQAKEEAAAWMSEHMKAMGVSA